MVEISSDVIRGYNDTMILNILLKEPSYGYEISKQIKEISKYPQQSEEHNSNLVYIAYHGIKKKSRYPYIYRGIGNRAYDKR